MSSKNVLETTFNNTSQTSQASNLKNILRDNSLSLYLFYKEGFVTYKLTSLID